MWSEFGEPLQPQALRAEELAWPPALQRSSRRVISPQWPPRVSPKSKWAAAIRATKTLGKVTEQFKGGEGARYKRPPSWRKFKEVGVVGIDATMDSKAPLLRRVLWGVVLIVCTALMLVQCLDRVNRYVEEPVNVNVRITHNETIEFPSITVCNKNAFNRTAALHLLVKHKALPANATESQVKIETLMGFNGMTSTDVWTNFAMDQDIFIPECWFGRGVKCEKAGNWTQVQTVIGPCFTFTLHDNQVKAIGTFHNLYLRLAETTPNTPGSESGVRVLLHEAADSPVLLARTHSFAAELGWSREVKLELRKFQMLSTAKNPCVDDPSYSEAICHFDCFQRAMYSVTKCRMPYMSEELQPSNVSECASAEEYKEAVREIQNLLFMGAWSTHQCDCAHECHETTYQAYPENMAFKPNEARLRIFYEELVFEQVSEELAYPMISLLCDIGGTLGLLMGASVLTVCELLEVAWSFFLQRCCRIKERETQAPGQVRWQGALAKMNRPPALRQVAAVTKMPVSKIATLKAPRSSHPFAP